MLISSVMGTWGMLMRALQNTQKWHLKSTTMYLPLYYWGGLLVLTSTPMLVRLTFIVVWNTEPTKIHVMAIGPTRLFGLLAVNSVQVSNVPPSNTVSPIPPRTIFFPEAYA